MDIFAGLDVSDTIAHVCLIYGAGEAIRREVVASDLDISAKWLAKHCLSLGRVVLTMGTVKPRGHWGWKLAKNHCPLVEHPLTDASTKGSRYLCDCQDFISMVLLLRTPSYRLTIESL